MNDALITPGNHMKLQARWWVSTNWGDALNPKLIHEISGAEVVWCDYPKHIKWLNSLFAKWRFIQDHQDLLNPITMDLLLLGDLVGQGLSTFLHHLNRRKITEELNSNDVFLVVGSILHQVDKKAVVWGAGFISEDSRFRERPKLICAVRGPLTREIILKQGLDCPEVFGDPALLYPKFYSPQKEKHYKLGIVPHFVDQSSQLVNKFKANDKVLVIDITGETNKFVDEICCCEKIASSSLHGIICADAYGIPSTWISFSDKIIGNGFKFRDYFASVGRNDTVPLPVSEKTSLQEIENSFKDYIIDIDLDKLLSVCPFNKDIIDL